ncbi:prepilin peptidase [Caulobacter sp. SLTY]|uniref:prepilin peptidase n=1 Tax=Caulobacter sp. SLTY TaxID=2683262 RepID=UPI0014133254|nr:A24 family peptidase [Caulobacter sp. SLTY]NBB17409.1 prepilin peptidase [Caulobacter sp. SLTY]
MYWDLAAILLGPVAGSFLGLVSLRLPAERPIVVGRSACQACGRTLGPLDLVPILSFLLLRGRCRTCGAAIPRRYIAIELACMALGVWSAAAFEGPLALISALLAWWLLLIAVVDAEHQWLPDRLTLPLGAVGLILSAVLAQLYPGFSPMHQAIGAAAGFLSLWLVAFLYRRLRGREGLGGGDPRLFGAIGAWVGWMGLPSVLVWAGIAGLSVVLATGVLRRSVSGDQRLPFGTFLAVGAWLVWVFGPIGV